MRLLVFFSLLLIQGFHGQLWTEDDESERISMIMAQEKRLYDTEMRNQQLRKDRKQFQALKAPVVQTQEQLPKSVEEEPSNHWCYHCTSPIGHLSAAMKRTIKEFLKLRRTAYPTEVATAECISARNFSQLHKQSCKHRYCQTLALVDTKEAASFVLRGCAENFGAINSQVLDEQEENTCTRLHDKLDIKECICKDKKYCYANGKMTNSSPSLMLTSSCFSIYLLLSLLTY